MVIVKKVVEANSLRMAHLRRVARISPAWLGVANNTRGLFQKVFPMIGKWLRRNQQVCRGPS
jgi:hypothetical protein